MHRVPLTLLAVGLMLGGCVAPGPCDYNPASCYPPQPPPQPYPYSYGYPSSYGYPPGPPPGQAYVGPDGFTYVNGYPVDVIDNQQVDLVFVPTLGGWGYYDNERRWRGAPPDIRGRLDRFHPQGRGVPPPGGFGPGPGRSPEPGYGRPVYAVQPSRSGVGAGPPPPASSRPPGPGPGGFASPGGSGPGAGPPPARRPPPLRRGCAPSQPRC